MLYAMEPKAMLMRICDVNRRTSMIKAVPTIENLQLKGQQYFNINVTRVVLEADGSDVIEDEVVECCAAEKLVFMLLSSDQQWTGQNEILQIFETPNQAQSESLEQLVEFQPIESIEAITPDPSESALTDEPPTQSSQGTVKRKADELDDSRLENAEETGNSSKASDQIVVKKTKKETKHEESEAYNLANYKINWNEISNDIVLQLKKCYKKKSTLSSNIYNRLATQIVEQIRKISKTIPYKVFSNAAFLATKKYPVLQDQDGLGNPIGDGSMSFAEKLKYTNNYLQRVIRGKQTTQNVPKGKSAAGIDPNYQKSGNPICAKNDLVALKRNSSDNLDEELLKNTLSYIRFKLDNTPVQTIVQELSIIRSYKLINYHFKAATGTDPAHFIENFNTNRETIIKATKKNRKERETDSMPDTQVFERISSCLREDFGRMLIFFEEGSTLEEVNSNNPYPTILAFDEGDNAIAYYIQTDNTVVSEKVESIVDAVQLCIMIYFVYYIKYPDFLSKTLEFLQIFLFKLNIKESRVTRRKGNNPRKGIVSFIKKISKLNNPAGADSSSPESDQQ